MMGRKAVESCKNFVRKKIEELTGIPPEEVFYDGGSVVVVVRADAYGRLLSKEEELREMRRIAVSLTLISAESIRRY